MITCILECELSAFEDDAGLTVAVVRKFAAIPSVGDEIRLASPDSSKFDPAFLEVVEIAYHEVPEVCILPIVYAKTLEPIGMGWSKEAMEEYWDYCDDGAGELLLHQLIEAGWGGVEVSQEQELRG